MQGWLRIKILLLLLCWVSFIAIKAQSNTWKYAMDGLKWTQSVNGGYGYHIQFKPNGPLGKDWIYGNYIDRDSKRRNVAYREGGKWVPLPFSGYYGNMATDMEMYGDTLYISGNFGSIILDKDSTTVSNTNLLKWYNDSLWANPLGKIYGIDDMTSMGDSLLFWGGGYINPPDTFETHFMTTNGGSDWQYPYSIIHPTENRAYFGADPRLEILPNGDILTINNGSPLGNPYSGIARWDGQQWHSYGNGLFGVGFVSVLDFEFYKGELYIGGTFAQFNTWNGDTISYQPQNPGNSIARWDGSAWHNLATGVLEGGVADMFVYDSVLYCQTFAGNWDYHKFGDASIPFFAGWNGTQWCGTPFNFSSPPVSFGIIKDTLYVSFYRTGTVNGAPVSYLNYYDGDFLKGPNAICSTPGIGREEDIKIMPDMTVYPNPAGSVIHLTLPRSQGSSIFEISDIKGRLLQSGTIYGSKDQIILNEDLNGIYILKVSNEDRVYVQKIMIE